MSSDGLFDTYFSRFTDEDLKKIDEAVATALEKEEGFDDTDTESFPSEIDGLNLNLLTETEWAKLPDIEQPVGDNEGPFHTSFASEINGPGYSGVGGPSIPVELEHSSDTPTMRPKNLQSPLRQFRRHGFLSVTDLSNPTWCEVQYDYGLRGRRSHPIEKRPDTFTSASGKIISVEQRVAQKNDIQTKQGRAIHKELQREIRAKELEVDITTKETRWALRIVNMMACLKELLYGPRNMTREIPVFGILHDEVIVGVIDELVCEPSADCAFRKRKAKDKTSKNPRKKRPSVSKSPDVSDGLIESSDSRSDCEDPKSESMYTVYLRDAKTRNRASIPDDREALGGRLQLFVYLTLLQNLITRERPFDFDVLWKKLDLKPDAKLPTKFLVQAQLISDSDLELISLNDLVNSFYKLINDKTMHVSPFLELVYYLRPSKSQKDKRVEDVTRREPPAPLETAATSCEYLPARSGPIVGTSRPPNMAQLQHLDGGVVSAKESRHNIDEEGIRRFPLIGRKAFFYNEEEMNIHVSRVLEWWHGERPPKGVSIHLTSRCRTCEYANNCEWRDAKALELRNSSGPPHLGLSSFV